MGLDRLDKVGDVSGLVVVIDLGALSVHEFDFTVLRRAAHAVINARAAYLRGGDRGSRNLARRTVLEYWQVERAFLRSLRGQPWGSRSTVSGTFSNRGGDIE